MKIRAGRLTILLAMLVALAAIAWSDGLPYAGKWKIQEGSGGPAKSLELVQNGDNGLIIKIVSANAVCDAKFDGQDYPATGPGIPDEYTLAIKKAGPRAFEMVQKLHGKTLYTSTFSVSEDGKTLTETDSGVTSGAPIKVVYDRQ